MDHDRAVGWITTRAPLKRPARARARAGPHHRPPAAPAAREKAAFDELTRSRSRTRRCTSPRLSARTRRREPVTLFSLVSSCRLHRLDPETYLRDLFRVLAHWPKHRHLELAPKYWTATRARLDPRELALEFGPLTLPPVLDTPTEQQPTPHGGP